MKKPLAEMDEPRRPGPLEQARDSAAYFVAERGRLLRNCLCGLAMAWTAFSVCSNFPTILTPWSLPIAASIVVLAAVDRWIGALTMCLVCVGQMTMVHPQFGAMTAVLVLVFLLLSIFGFGRSSAVLVAPYLTAYGLAATIPLGFGLAGGKRSGWVWTGMSFIWVALHASLFGDPRLGLPINPYTRQLLEQSREMPFAFSKEWLTAAPKMVSFVDLESALIGIYSANLRWISLPIQLILWCGVAYGAGYLYQRRRLLDKMAQEYLERLTQKVHIPNQRKLGGATAISTVGLIVGYIILGQAFRGVVYNPTPEALVDAIAALAIFIPLYIILEGIPERGKRAKGRRFAQKAGLSAKRGKGAARGGVQVDSKAPPAVGVGRDTVEALKQEVRGAPRLRTETPAPRPSAGGSAMRTPIGTASGIARGAGTASKWSPGEKIDNQYTIVKEYVGGMGIVYQVVDDFSGKKYAVKTLREEFLNNREAIERFATEAKTWVNLDYHENIVQAMLFRIVEEKPLLFLEFVHGTDLEQLMKSRGPFSVAQAIEWGKQICKGMDYAHNKDVGGGRIGIIHRDLKPANIMITREGVAKITDFGLAKIVEATTHMTRQATGLGTLGYMSPEQLEDARSVDQRADIYSFGAVFYEMLTETQAISGESVANLTMSILTKMAQAPSNKNPAVPPELDTIVLRCLEKQREDRYSSFMEVYGELDRITITPEMRQVAGQTVSSQSWTPPPTTVPGSFGRRPSTPSAARRPSTPSTARTRPGGTTGSITTAIEAIMFIDMAGSTALGSKYGDDYVLEMKERLGNMVQIESRREGVLFSKGTGDGFMLTFPEAINAARAAVGVMKRAKDHNAGIPQSRQMRLRMGIHFGQVNIDSTGDRHGTSANLAARIEDAKIDQFHQTRMGISKDELQVHDRILVSEVVMDELKDSSQFQTRLVGYFDFQGISGRRKVYELIWQ